MVLKPGALIMAGDSVCCIDDLECLEEKSVESIREAMDQTSITFSKAGIHTRLNVNTSVFAAYSPSACAKIPARIASCFDLVLLLRGSCTSAADDELARHIISLTQKYDRNNQAKVSTSDLRRYIEEARSIEPQITPEAEERLRNCYV